MNLGAWEIGDTINGERQLESLWEQGGLLYMEFEKSRVVPMRSWRQTQPWRWKGRGGLEEGIEILAPRIPGISETRRMDGASERGERGAEREGKHVSVAMVRMGRRGGATERGAGGRAWGEGQGGRGERRGR